MQLDYNNKLNIYGDSIIRLYDFKRSEALLFAELIKTEVLLKHKSIDLSSIVFIKSRNCTLQIRIGTEDLGVITNDEVDFYCYLTHQSYKQMLDILTPFCERDTKGYAYLYDLDNQIDFLFSPGGTW